MIVLVSLIVLLRRFRFFVWCISTSIFIHDFALVCYLSSSCAVELHVQCLSLPPSPPLSFLFLPPSPPLTSSPPSPLSLSGQVGWHAHLPIVHDWFLLCTGNSGKLVHNNFQQLFICSVVLMRVCVCVCIFYFCIIIFVHAPIMF